MLSQNVAKATVPSYYMIRTNLPHRKPQNQWEGVYYFSGITKRQRHVLLMQRKRERMAALQSFEAYRSPLQEVWDKLFVDGDPRSWQGSVTKDPQQWRMLFRLSCQLAHCGLHTEAAQGWRALQESSSSTISSTSSSLNVAHYVTMLQHMPAQRLAECLLHSDASGDPVLPYKLLGDRGGEERAREAYNIFEAGIAQLQLSCPGSKVVANASSAATQLVNHLMETLLTCGYKHVKAIPNAIYDRMGVLGIAPTATTYELVLTALALVGDIKSAEDIHRFLSRYQDHQNIRGYDALMMGYREAKAFDQCDRLWQELVDRRWPRASVSTAELYLRSIIDHSVTPVSEPLQRFGDLNVIAKKKVPVVLTQMEDLGIPRVQLSRPLQDEIEDALRKYSIYRDRFYEWGRAVKQFDFIEFRRRQGWLYDIHLMKNTTKMMPPIRDPTQPDATLAAAAMAELPAFFNEKQMWEKDALEELLFVHNDKERTDDVRNGDIYYDDTRSIHERSATWMNEVPETRYDQLYGISQPDIAKIGIRRHLEVEYTNRSQIMEKDAALMRKTLSRGRRLRHRAEVFRTHRSESTSVPASATTQS